MEGITTVVWSKSNLTIKNQDHYEIKSGPVHGKDNEIKSTLTIYNFTSDDQGTYTCYCYYNSTLITSRSKHDIPVTSGSKSTTLRVDCTTTTTPSKNQLLYKYIYNCLILFT